MKFRFAAVCLAALIASHAAEATVNFDTFILGRSSATQPLGSGDKFPVIQGGVTTYLQANQVATLTDSQTLTNKTINGSSNTLTVRLGSDVTGTLGTALGGTNLTSFTAGGVLCATSSSVLASSSVLTSNLPVIGGGNTACPGTGSVTGNTTKFVTNTGTNTTGQGGSWDGNGNWVNNANAVFTNVAQTFSSQQSFGSTLGSQRTTSSTSDTLTTTTGSSSDCGKTIYYTAATTVTVTLPNNGVVNCSMALEEGGAGRLALSAASGASFTNSHGFTGTFNAAGAVIGLYIDTNSGGAAAHYVLTGDGS